MKLLFAVCFVIFCPRWWTLTSHFTQSPELDQSNVNATGKSGTSPVSSAVSVQIQSACVHIERGHGCLLPPEPRLVFPRPRLFGVENEKALPSSAISAKVISMTLLLCVSGYLLRLGASLGKSSPARKFRVPGTAMGCSIPENVLF